MKKIKHFSIGLLSGAILATGISVFADDGLEKIEAYLRPSLPITLDGKKIFLENPPVMYDGSTHLRLRDVAAITGMGVHWNEATQTVELQSVSKVESNNSGVKEDEEQIIFYKDKDIYNTLTKDDPTNPERHITSSVVNGKFVRIYKNKTYIVPDKDMYYDRENDIFYTSERFYLQFLDTSELTGLQKYTKGTNGITKI